MVENDWVARIAMAAAAVQAEADRLGRSRSDTTRPTGSSTGLAAGRNSNPPAPKSSLGLSPPRAPGLGAPVRVLVSWAHSHPDWEQSRAEEWERIVAEFTTALRQFGVEADVDLYHLDEIGIDWTRFGPAAVAAADHVLIAMSEAWAERWSGNNAPDIGAGAAAEADTLKGLFQRDQQAFQRKVIIVLLPGASTTDIPPDLMRLGRHRVVPDEADSYTPLLRALSQQPRYPAPPLGGVPKLPPLVVRRTATNSGGDAANVGEPFSAVRQRAKQLEAELSRASLDADARQDALRHLAALRGMLDALSQAPG